MSVCGFHVGLNRSLLNERFSVMISLNLLRNNLMPVELAGKATSRLLNQCTATQNSSQLKK